MLRITGDINLTDGYFDTGIGTGSLIKHGMNPFQHISQTEDDYWIGNMEYVCASSSDNIGLAAKQFIIAPQQLEHIRHFNLYGIANNHVMQHGSEAYQEMQAYLKSKGVAYAGSNDKHTHEFSHQCKQVSVTALCMRPDNFTDKPLYWHLPEYNEMEQELRNQRHCDFRIVFIHWGNEFINYPYIDQKQLAHYLIDCGANLVVGMHPHVLQGYERYKEGTIFYSLGNFVFNMPWEPTKYSIVVNVNLKEEPHISYDYVHIGKDYCPRLVKSVPKNYCMEHLNTLLNINEENEKYYRKVATFNHQYQQVNRRQTLANFLKMKHSDAWGILKDFVNRKLG